MLSPHQEPAALDPVSPAGHLIRQTRCTHGLVVACHWKPVLDAERFHCSVAAPHCTALRTGGSSQLRAMLERSARPATISRLSERTLKIISRDVPGPRSHFLYYHSLVALAQ